MTRLDLFVIWSCVITVIVSGGYLFCVNDGLRKLAWKIVCFVESQKARTKSI